jgi:chromosome segregation ATPase
VLDAAARTAGTMSELMPHDPTFAQCSRLNQIATLVRDFVAEETSAAMMQERTAIEQERTAIEQERTAIQQERAALQQARIALDKERVAVNEERVAVNEERVAVNKERAAVDNERENMRKRLREITQQNQVLYEENAKRLKHESEQDALRMQAVHKAQISLAQQQEEQLLSHFERLDTMLQQICAKFEEHQHRQDCTSSMYKSNYDFLRSNILHFLEQGPSKVIT